MHVHMNSPGFYLETYRILLPPLPATRDGEICLRFKYHMFGFHVRELKVYMERNHDPMGAERRLIEPAAIREMETTDVDVNMNLQKDANLGGALVSRWELASIRGQQGNRWLQAEISVFMEKGDRVSFSWNHN